MTADFNRRVDAIIRAEAENRARQTGALESRYASRAATAAEYLRQVVPMAAEAFAALARRGLQVRYGDPAGRDQRTQYIRLRTSTLSSAQAGADLFLTELGFLHANGLLIDRDRLRYRRGQVEEYVRGGGLGEPPTQPPPGARPDSNGMFEWYDDAALRHLFARRYRALSSGPLNGVATPGRLQGTDNDGIVHVDFDAGAVYVVWQFLTSAEASKSTVGDRLSDNMRVETLQAYLTRVVTREAVLHERRNER
ncbi:hypothetical protein [Gordonia sp. NPDC058843]|uniref:hypothetical protein n=1 Tax=Gordonia sp. NPDC058843 TaxID=3346648 RepID=UPI0036B51B11